MRIYSKTRPVVPGVYCIRNLKNGKVYIGSSKNVNYRWTAHQYALRHNEAVNQELQQDWNISEEEDFNFSILEACPIDEIRTKESYWIAFFDAMNPDKGYNLSVPGGSIPKIKQAISKPKYVKKDPDNIVPNHLRNHKKTAVMATNILTGEKTEYSSMSWAARTGRFILNKIQRCVNGGDKQYQHRGYYFQKA